MRAGAEKSYWQAHRDFSEIVNTSFGPLCVAFKIRVSHASDINYRGLALEKREKRGEEETFAAPRVLAAPYFYYLARDTLPRNLLFSSAF